MRSSTTAGFAGGIPFRRGKRRPSFGAIVINGVVALFALYLLMPIVLLLIGSIGQSWTNTLLPAGFTWRWFAELAADPSLRRAFSVSFVVALACCALDTLAGVPLAYALHHRALRGRGVAARVVMLTPIGVPALTLGFGYIVVFGGDALPWLGTLPLMIAAHAVLTLPYLLQTLLSDLRHLDLAKLEACAATLGAPPLRQFFTIVLPNLRQSLFSGLVMVAALSIGEFQVSNLIAGFRYRNFPVVLLQAFYGASGIACAASVVLLLLAVLATLASTHTVQRLK
ncbi:binding--dependent transport system inner membrane component family protein [Burkholderia pseudomallei MSHR4377]|uniref:ABC transporter permease n=1 Tax=Burkholderia pseudomallei TaxID=28450 RepID=UPI0005106188|nr:ABC transporter permease subunit [Burkholderia pseudomallei]KGC47432.1 binding--dependent transport system inner membrane component family protein [Burkholderia pseudomallei]KGC73828.1 binding--dependent transport system inner membrane component family protein [Burkholderia pseudomallei]KGV01174.1 binding--dependent transport system inner membrane component family protein [Burkholderia pseudomallei MSHR4377]KGV19051.1 binding--dependent transport system inner membrane component family protei